MPIELTPDLRGLLSLHLVPGIGPRLTAALLDRFGSADAVLQAAPEELCEVPHVGDKLSHAIHQAMRSIDLSKELELLEKHETRLLVLGSGDYPTALTEIPDVPHLLYVRGTLEERDVKAVGIVGSRHCTAYGRRVAERLAMGLAQKGYTIVSGLARGIDAVAHQGALKAGGRTLAVLAGGLSRIYPPEHQELAVQVQASGALVSESAMTMEPMAGMFPARNRLISGLSRGIVVVEAAEKSGALITARHAAEQGRMVFAVPGPVDSAASGGTNKLIRDGAILVRGVEDMLEELEGVSSPVSAPPVAIAAMPPGLNDSQKNIMEFLREKPRHVDEMARHLGRAVHEVMGDLTMLEMKKAIRRLPGNMYERP